MLSKERIKEFVEKEVVGAFTGIFSKFSKVVEAELKAKYDEDLNSYLALAEEEYNNDLANKDYEIASLNEKLEQLRRDNEADTKIIADLNRSVSNKENAAENLRKRSRELSTKNEELKGRNKELEKQNDKLGIELVRATGRLNELEKDAEVYGELKEAFVDVDMNLLKLNMQVANKVIAKFQVFKDGKVIQPKLYKAMDYLYANRLNRNVEKNSLKTWLLQGGRFTYLSEEQCMEYVDKLSL